MKGWERKFWNLLSPEAAQLVKADIDNYTPAPWTISYDDKHEQQRISAGDHPVAVTKIDANARLIAAAPDLYDALCEVEVFLLNHVDKTDTVTWLLGKVRAAIAKAEGPLMSRHPSPCPSLRHPSEDSAAPAIQSPVPAGAALSVGTRVRMQFGWPLLEQHLKGVVTGHRPNGAVLVRFHDDDFDTIVTPSPKLTLAPPQEDDE